MTSEAARPRAPLDVAAPRGSEPKRASAARGARTKQHPRVSDSSAAKAGEAEAATRDPWPESLTQKLAALPARPGCYVFRDRQGGVLYVGKAKSLRPRVRSYFQAGSGDTRAFLPLLQRSVGDLETLVTASEKEAVILENSLIKEWQPRYNVKLRDDKEYLILRLSTEHRWPRLELVRRPKPDGARYFGPYPSASAARRALHVVEKHFQLRTCSDRELAGRKRPCLQFQIKRCPAPCAVQVDAERYAEQVRAVGLFLDGRHDELTRALEARMREAARAYEYEDAARCRDQLRAIESLHQAQRVVAITDRDQDVVGLYREGDLVELAVLHLRAGRVVEAMSLSRSHVEVPDDELVAALLREHYGEGGAGHAAIPDEVLLPCLPDGAAGVAEWLTDERQAVAAARAVAALEAGAEPGPSNPPRRCRLLSPSRGAKRALLELATDNARHAFLEKRRAGEDMDARLARLQARLGLPALPRRIECCDISHLGGGDTVGAVVALLDGRPDKARYRSYTVRGAALGDDYAAMSEVLSRRFARGRDADAGADWELPDLFVVDGGRGQLGVALGAAGDLGLHELRIVGLAKERESVTGDKLVDRVYLPGQKNPLSLRSTSPELYLLALARDEAHRFANRGRTSRGKRRSLESALDSIPGIGPKTRQALLRALGSVARIARASDATLLAVPGLRPAQLRALRAHLAAPPEDAEPIAPASPAPPGQADSLQAAASGPEGFEPASEPQERAVNFVEKDAPS